MWGRFEKIISITSTIITIITFVLSFIGWMNVYSLPPYVPPSQNAAIFILFVFNLSASYAISAFLANLAANQQPSIAISFFLTATFAFSAIYLGGYLIQSYEGESRLRMIGYVHGLPMSIYMFSLFFIYGVKYMYPNGFSFGEWFKGSFTLRPWKIGGCMFINMAILSEFLQEFSKNI